MAGFLQERVAVAGKLIAMERYDLPHRSISAALQFAAGIVTAL